MNKDKQRIAIAEACGWVNCLGPREKEYNLLPDKDVALAMGEPVGRFIKAYPDGFHHALPDYLNDLNAMHEAEKLMFAENLYQDYWPILEHVVNVASLAYSATASQRAEAFLKTLNLWQPE